MALSVTPLLLTLAACKHHDGSTGETGTTLPDDVLPPASVLQLDDLTNMTWSATADVPTRSISAGQNFTVDFGSLSTTLLGAVTQPELVKQITVTAATLSTDQILLGLARGGVDSSGVAGKWLGAPQSGQTTVRSSDLQDTAHVPFDAATWVSSKYTLIVLATDRDGVLLSAALATADGSGTSVAIDDTARISYSVTPSGTALSTTPAMSPWSFDWSALAKSASGAPLQANDVEQLWIAQLDPDADWSFVLDPQTGSSQYFVAPVHSVTTLDATLLNNPDGLYFDGFTEPGTWYVGLSCTTCSLSIPYYVGRLQVVRE